MVGKNGGKYYSIDDYDFDDHDYKWDCGWNHGLLYLTATPNTTEGDLAVLADLPEIQLPKFDDKYKDNSEMYDELFTFFSMMPLIELNRLELTDNNLVFLSKLTNLKSLVFYSDKITDEGLAHLGNMVGLQLLACSVPNATDTGIAALANLTTLRILDISSKKMTDEGLLNLAKFVNLMSLTIRDCENVTENGLEELRKLMPKTKIDRY